MFEYSWAVLVLDDNCYVADRDAVEQRRKQAKRGSRRLNTTTPTNRFPIENGFVGFVAM